MSAENQNTIRPAAANLDQPQQELNLAAIVEHSLADPTRDGKQIMDEFVGNLVANDGVTTRSGDRVTPQKVLAEISYATMAITDESKANGLTRFTRNDGLRGAVSSLINDQRSLELMPFARGALHYTTEGIALTSPTQVKAYLESFARKAGQSEEAPWVERLTSMYADPHQEVKLDAELGATIQADFKAAELSGADIEMLRRSANTMITPEFEAAREAESKKAQEIGNVALEPNVTLTSNKLRVTAQDVRDDILNEVFSSDHLPKVSLLERPKDRLLVTAEELDNDRLTPIPEVKTEVRDIISESGEKIGFVAIATPIDSYMGSRDSFIRDLRVPEGPLYHSSAYLEVLKSLPKGRGLRTEGVLSLQEKAIWQGLVDRGLARASSKGGTPTGFETTYNSYPIST